MSERWTGFLAKAAVGALAALVIMFAPLPWFTPRIFTYLQVPAGVFLLICYLGILLYDTLFQDRYRR